MGFSKIVRIVGIIFAVVSGLIHVPSAAMFIALIGLVGGYFVEEERRLPFMVMTLTLALVHGALAQIPLIGTYLTDILENISALFNAAACTVIVMSIIDRLKP